MVSLVQRYAVRATHMGIHQDLRYVDCVDAHDSGSSWLCFVLRALFTKSFVRAQVSAWHRSVEGLRILWISQNVDQARVRTTRVLNQKFQYKNQSTTTRHETMLEKFVMLVTKAQEEVQHSPQRVYRYLHARRLG
jgi:hypothetical protein